LKGAKDEIELDRMNKQKQGKVMPSLEESLIELMYSPLLFAIVLNDIAQ